MRYMIWGNSNISNHVPIPSLFPCTSKQRVIQIRSMPLQSQFVDSLQPILDSPQKRLKSSHCRPRQGLLEDIGKRHEEILTGFIHKWYIITSWSRDCHSDIISISQGNFKLVVVTSTVVTAMSYPSVMVLLWSTQSILLLCSCHIRKFCRIGQHELLTAYIFHSM